MKYENELKELFGTLRAVKSAIKYSTTASDKEGYDFKVAKLGSTVISKEYIPNGKATENDGSYLHPFPYTDGMSITEGLWYSLEDGNIWQAIVTSDTSEMTKDYFDIVEV